MITVPEASCKKESKVVFARLARCLSEPGGKQTIGLKAVSVPMMAGDALLDSHLIDVREQQLSEHLNSCTYIDCRV